MEEPHRVGSTRKNAGSCEIDASQRGQEPWNTGGEKCTLLETLTRNPGEGTGEQENIVCAVANCRA
jgi:hypothetical protein